MAELDAKQDPAVRAAIVTVLKAGLGANDGLAYVFAHTDGTFVYKDGCHAIDHPGVAFHSPDLAADAFLMDLPDFR